MVAVPQRFVAMRQVLSAASSMVVSPVPAARMSRLIRQQHICDETVNVIFDRRAASYRKRRAAVSGLPSRQHGSRRILLQINGGIGCGRSTG
jgi:hypothetical protein